MIAIIGAGPAGLAVAHALRRRGLAARIFEAGPRVAEALRALDPDLPLVSPPALSWPHLPWPAGPHTFGGLVQALEGWAQGLEITFDFKVLGVDAHNGGFRIRGELASAAEKVSESGGLPRLSAAEAGLSAGSLCFATARRDADLEATAVVCCTGLLSHPRLPPGIGPTSIPWWHTRDVRPHHIKGRQHLLVVGGGVSAGETLATWLATAQPTDRATLALHSPLRTLPRSMVGLDTHYLAWLPEHLPARVGRWRLGLRTEPLLDPIAQRALRRGRIEKASGFKGLEGEVVNLEDGTTLTPDAVVFATGYHHPTPVDDLLTFDADGWPILRRCEARPGLYLVGVRYARTLASPFLRGIQRDAEYVVRHLRRAA